MIFFYCFSLFPILKCLVGMCFHTHTNIGGGCVLDHYHLEMCALCRRILLCVLFFSLMIVISVHKMRRESFNFLPPLLSIVKRDMTRYLSSGRHVIVSSCSLTQSLYKRGGVRYVRWQKERWHVGEEDSYSLSERTKGLMFCKLHNSRDTQKHVNRCHPRRRLFVVGVD